MGGPLSEAVFNQRTDDRMLEIFSMGLTGQGGELGAVQVLIPRKARGGPGTGWGLLRLCCYFRSVGKCSGLVTGRDVWVAFQDMSKQVCAVGLL